MLTSQVIEAAARAAHEANRAYCLALGDTSLIPNLLVPKATTT